MVFPVTISSSMLLISVLALSLVLSVLIQATVEHFMCLWLLRRWWVFLNGKFLEVDRIIVAWIWYSERKSLYYNSWFLNSVKNWRVEVILDVDDKFLKIHRIIKRLKVALYCFLLVEFYLFGYKWIILIQHVNYLSSLFILGRCARKFLI